MLGRGLHVQYNKLEEKSVINFEVRDLNNKDNVIGQNSGVEKRECRGLRHMERRGYKRREKEERKRRVQKI